MRHGDGNGRDSRACVLPGCLRWALGYLAPRMIANKQDLIGKRFGRLVVLSFDKVTRSLGGRSRSIWLCKCDCGLIREVGRSNLLTGNTASCGCQSGDTKRGREFDPERHPQVAKGPSNKHAAEYHFRSPDNHIFKGRNINDFVRENSSLFDPCDTVWVKYKRVATSYCRASRGLHSLSKNRRGHIRHSWKGWTRG